VDQSQHRAQDADGRRIAAGCLPDLDRQFLIGLVGGDFDVENLAQLERIDPIDNQAQAFGQIGVAHLVELALQAQQAFAPRRSTPVEHVAPQGLAVGRRRYEDPRGHFQTLEEIEQAALQDHGAYRADDDDDEGRRLDQRSDFSPFNCLPDDDPSQGKQQPRYATPVHAFSLRVERKRAIAWLWSWQTRDSETPITAPISFKFISCS